MLRPMSPLAFLATVLLSGAAIIYCIFMLLGVGQAEAVLVVPNDAPPQTRLWVDQRTGCHYFVTELYSTRPITVTPRMKSNGSQLCDTLGVQ